MVTGILYLNIDNDQMKNLFTKIAKGVITMGTIEIRYAMHLSLKICWIICRKNEVNSIVKFKIPLATLLAHFC